jgi:hypothetical protein
MSCDISTYCTTIADFASYSELSLELGDHPTARKPDDERDKSLKRCRSGPNISNENRHETGSCTIPDTTHTDPQHVWGDEGPIND